MKFKTELFMTQFQWKTEKKRINIKKKQNANFTLSEDRNQVFNYKKKNKENRNKKTKHALSLFYVTVP